MKRIITHPSVQTSVVAGAVLATIHAATGIPWWLWTTWATLSAVSVVQAVRADEPRSGAAR